MRKTLLVGFVSALVAGGAFLAGGAGAAQAPPPPDMRTLALASEQARQAALRARQLGARAERAEDRAEQASARNAALAARIEAAEARLTAAEMQIALVARLRSGLRARIAERQGPAVRLAAALQTMARRPAALALVQPGSLEDAVHVRSLLSATLPEIRIRTAMLHDELERSEKLRRQAEQARRILAESREELRLRRLALARFEAEQRSRSEDLAGLALAESDRALAFGEEARALAKLAGTRGEQERLAASLSELPGPKPRPGTRSAPPGSGRGRAPFLLPVKGRVVTGVGEISESGVHSRGLTLETEPEAPVVAPAAGRIAYAGPFRSYGRILIIDHGGGWTSVMTGLNRLDSAAGQSVARGEAVGRAGRSVMVELRRDGRPVPVAQLVVG